MNANTIIGIVVLVLVAGAVVLILTLRSRRQQAVIAAMSPAEREHRDATDEYDDLVKAADKALRDETRARDSRLTVAKKSVATAGAFGTNKISSYKGKDGSIALSGLNITVQGQAFPLDPTITATVDTAGNLATSSRSTLTRVAAGGLVFGPLGAIVGASAKKTKMHDTRELHLLVEGPGFAQLITCNPDDGPKVRQLAVAIKQAAANVRIVAGERARQISVAAAGLANEQANTAALDAANDALRTAKLNTARIDEAARQLRIEASAHTDPVDGGTLGEPA